MLKSNLSAVQGFQADGRAGGSTSARLSPFSYRISLENTNAINFMPKLRFGE